MVTDYQDSDEGQASYAAATVNGIFQPASYSSAESICKRGHFIPDSSITTVFSKTMSLRQGYTHFVFIIPTVSVVLLI